MAVIIPFDPAISYQRIDTTLGTYPCIVSARWNSRAGTWYIDVHEVDDTPIVCGERLVLGAVLGRRSPHQIFTGTDEDRLSGLTTRPMLFAVDQSKTGVECGYADLGQRVQVWYLTASDAFLAQLPNQRAPSTPVGG